MAVAPPNEDAFLREVNDELRKDQLTSFWQRWGRWLVIGVVIALAALAALLYWQQHSANQAGARAEQYVQALQQVGGGNAKAAEPALETLAKADDSAYAAAARMTQAGILVEQGDAKAASAAFAALAADAKVPEPIRQLALIRQTTIDFDTLPPQAVIQRLGSMAVPGNPWLGSAGELVAIAHLKLNQPAEAGRIFAAIASDADMPETLRSRATKMAGALGVDAVRQPAAQPKE
ncbi:tetratricopeptide repeat protein [Sphingomonas sp. 1P06PA]|uniref:tetratricopeptide repeat protein n=1 Tax=Sphingomonas sp. 1P06PA TaxID=554121 RepID=UPI0039A6BA7A